MATRCRCAGASHENRCPSKWVEQQRSRLYEGLYDAQVGARRNPSGGRVQLLNAGLVDDDATSRRFALLEVD